MNIKIGRDFKLKFSEIKLDVRLHRAIESAGFKEPTEIQRRAIPVVLSGVDLIASAQTGTGKTAAFVLPALNRLLKASKKPGNGPRALVLTPTRELALQINQHVRQLSRGSKISSGSIVDNTVGVGANDPQGRRQLARYMIRNPFSLKKMEYQAQQGMVVYRSRHHGFGV